MPSSLAIGDFSRATHLSIKTLRHYHRIGLLVPAHIDPDTGYRRYATSQIPTAQIIRRFRSLEMPLQDIHALIETADPVERNELIATHLQRLETIVARTQKATDSLRDLLEPPTDATPVAIEHRQVSATQVAAISQVIEVKDATAWYQGALGELYGLLAAQKIAPSGPGGAIYANGLFTHGQGEAIVFVPCDQAIRPTGRVGGLIVPEVDLALTVHIGPHDSEIDRAYGALGAYVNDHALGVDGPIREYYVVGPHETADETDWRTEIGWPIFHTGSGADSASDPSERHAG